MSQQAKEEFLQFKATKSLLEDKTEDNPVSQSEDVQESNQQAIFLKSAKTYSGEVPQAQTEDTICMLLHASDDLFKCCYK